MSVKHTEWRNQRTLSEAEWQRVDRFTAWAKHGPSGRVVDVDVTPEKVFARFGFCISLDRKRFNTEIARPSPPPANSTKNLPIRSVNTAISRLPFSAVAARGSPMPVLVVARCHGRVMLTQPRLIALISSASSPRRRPTPASTGAGRKPGPGWFRLRRLCSPGFSKICGYWSTATRIPIAHAQKHVAAMVQLAGPPPSGRCRRGH